MELEVVAVVVQLFVTSIILMDRDIISMSLVAMEVESFWLQIFPLSMA